MWCKLLLYVLQNVKIGRSSESLLFLCNVESPIEWPLSNYPPIGRRKNILLLHLVAVIAWISHYCQHIWKISLCLTPAAPSTLFTTCVLLASSSEPHRISAYPVNLISAHQLAQGYTSFSLSEAALQALFQFAAASKSNWKCFQFTLR